MSLPNPLDLMTPAERDACLHDMMVFGQYVIHVKDDGTVVRIPPEQWHDR